MSEPGTKTRVRDREPIREEPSDRRRGSPAAGTRLPRVFHGTANVAGIGGHLAAAQRELGLDAHFLVYWDNTTHQNADQDLDLKRFPAPVRGLIELWTLVRNLLRYDVFHFYYGRSFLKWNLDLPLLKLFRRKICMTYCGSDIRLNEIEYSRNAFWRLAPASTRRLRRDSTRKRRMRWHRLWVDRFFAPRDLYAYAASCIPTSRIDKDLWLHNTIDTRSETPGEVTTADLPRIVHAPSHKGIKGTEHVERAIRELANRRLEFRYRTVHGVANEEARRIYRDEADIIINQMILGTLGTLDFEGMAYGKPVVTYVLDELQRDHFPDCPVVNANVDNLADRLEWLIRNPEERIRLGREGRAYVERHVDRQQVAARLIEIYREL